MASHTFPRNTESYKGQIRFTLVDANGGPGNETSTAKFKPQTINLYLPQGVQYADKVEYENADLGAIGGAFADGQVAEDFSIPSEQLSDKGIQGLLVNSIVSVAAPTAAAASRARNKVAPNPNTRALFKQVSLRAFAFQFKLIPVDEQEANTITEIIKVFRTELYPSMISVEAAGASLAAGYNFPFRFKIEQFYGGMRLPAQEIAPAYLDSFTTNYNTTNQTFFRGSNGRHHFSEIDIAMTFTESKPLSRKDIGKGF
jgi:hypothetical protein|tara:strand:+ start:1274 stop:2044 length:771 start_codon:yes stop_codon:yes gene_type:complete